MILADSLATTQTDYLAVSQAIAILENRAGELPEGGTNKKKRQKPDAPFFLGVGLVRPHVPLIAPENCFTPYPDNEMELPEYEIGENVPEQALTKRNMKVWGMDKEQQKKVISGYMASVKFMDRQVGRLLEALDRLGLRENTIVVFISDHGYNLGEHDCWSKGALWEGTVRVPMIISHPGAEAHHGTSYSGITELIDLYPTLVEICGKSERQPEILQGRSLADVIIQGSLEMPDRVAYTTTHRGMGSTIRNDRWRYTRWGEGPPEGNEELYDHRSDPEEFINLADKKKYQDILIEMREHYERARQKAKGI
jgi:arylsulfatase A-like enzyme